MRIARLLVVLLVACLAGSLHATSYTPNPYVPGPNIDEVGSSRAFYQSYSVDYIARDTGANPTNIWSPGGNVWNVLTWQQHSQVREYEIMLLSYAGATGVEVACTISDPTSTVDNAPTAANVSAHGFVLAGQYSSIRLKHPVISGTAGATTAGGLATWHTPVWCVARTAVGADDVNLRITAFW